LNDVREEGIWYEPMIRTRGGFISAHTHALLTPTALIAYITQHLERNAIFFPIEKLIYSVLKIRSKR
jgi:hypothetical protein